MIGFLMSFFYFGTYDMGEMAEGLVPRPPLFADSGAFSAHSQNQPVDVGAYAEWLHRWRGLFEAYANLDVKGDWRAGRRNQDALERRGLRPVPVFHGGEPWRVLEEMCAEYDYVALGGLSGAALRTANPKVLAWMNRAFEIADGTRLHAFGLWDWKIVRRFPWHSVDSSVLGAGYRYGHVRAYDPYSRQWRLWMARDRRAWGRWGWLIREYGEDPHAFAGAKGRDGVKAVMRLMGASYRRAMDQLPHPTQVYVVDSSATYHGEWRAHIVNAAANG